MNDAGDIHYAFGAAPSVDLTVRDAVQEGRDLTREDSYVMSGWWGCSRATRLALLPRFSETRGMRTREAREANLEISSRLDDGF